MQKTKKLGLLFQILLPEKRPLDVLLHSTDLQHRSNYLLHPCSALRHNGNHKCLKRECKNIKTLYSSQDATGNHIFEMLFLHSSKRAEI